MATKLGPYIFPGAIDGGRLTDLLERDAAAAKAKSRDDALRFFNLVKQGHADWLDSYHLTGRTLRRANSPFSETYNALEKWLEDTKPPKPPRPKRGFVYLIGTEGDDAVVKIGFAVDVDDRRATLQTSSHRALKVLATVKGTLATEKEIHRRFAADHIRGEWFRLSPEIVAFIAAAAQRSE